MHAPSLCESASSPAVLARGLCKSFPHPTLGTTLAVDHIDLCVPRGICFGLLGPNGAGKTTTLRMLLGLMPPTSGTLELLGLPMPEAECQVRAKLGIVPQADNLDPDLSVEQNLRVYASFFGVARHGLDARIDQLLRFAHLTDRRAHRVESLSGGMKRRLTLARALINAPELLVLDEPTTGLDPQARHTLWSRLEELKAQGTTLLLTTHYMDEAERLCDELVVMDHGRVLDQGSPQALIARHVEPWVIEIRFAAHLETHFAPLSALGKLERHGSSLFLYTHERKLALPQIERLAAVQPTPPVLLQRPAGLEDVFLRLTGRDLREDA
ncbi:MAG: ATP-binding cassette domain-containing protein [Halothiobacillaceae bacterium]|nr:ATP-binding cassette domain-containing protein [Halothiobacillaceae bacterium]